MGDSLTQRLTYFADGLALTLVAYHWILPSSTIFGLTLLGVGTLLVFGAVGRA
jgi:hypothetical protein